MALIEKKLMTELTPVHAPQAASQAVDMAYHHHEEEDGVELDVIEQLRANISKLQDLQLRLGFMNCEISSLIGTGKKR